MGGMGGIKNPGQLEASLMAPQHRHFYEQADVFACAACLCYSIAMNHPFGDGNKRTALISGMFFLRLNGCLVSTSCENSPWDDVMVDLVTHRISEDDLAAMFRRVDRALRNPTPPGGS